MQLRNCCIVIITIVIFVVIVWLTMTVHQWIVQINHFNLALIDYFDPFIRSLLLG